MVSARYSRNFVKGYRKAGKKVQNAFLQRQKLFIDDPFHPLLRNHALSGRYKGMRSINVTGDWRAIYSEQVHKHGQVKQGKSITFEEIGTHSQLYK